MVMAALLQYNGRPLTARRIAVFTGALLKNVKGNGAALFGDDLILDGLDISQYQLFNTQDAGKGDGKYGVSGHEMQL